MNLDKVINAKSVALYISEKKENKIPYLGVGFFPTDKKASLDISWIKASNGLPISLAPSNFDAMATIRPRSGFEVDKQQMAFFRESIAVSEKDKLDIVRAQETSDIFLVDALKNTFNDVKTLSDAAEVVPERMRFQLLFPESNGPAIYFSSKGVVYSYNYDPDGTWASSNRTDLSGTRQWANTTTAKPLTDIQTIIDSADDPIKYLVMSQAEINLMMATDQVKSAILAQNISANVFLTTALVKTLIANTFPGVEVIVYKKKFKKEDGTSAAYVPDGFVAFLPEGPVGKTWFGMTPEEITLFDNPNVEVAMMDGVAITVKTEYGPPAKTETTVSELVLPSYERMNSVYLLATGTSADEGGSLDALTVTLAKGGTTTGATKATITEDLGTGNSYRIKVYASGAGKLPNYEQKLSTWTAYTEGDEIKDVTNGQELVIVEVDSNYLAKAAAKVDITTSVIQ